MDGVTVDAAICSLFLIYETELMHYFLLNRGNTSWVLTFDYISKCHRKLHVKLLEELVILYDVYGYIAVHITQFIIV